MRRRSLLAAGAAAAGTLAGCIGLPPDCEDGAVVYRSLLRGWYVDYPVNDGAFGFGTDRTGAPARRLAELARERGYTAEHYFSEDLGRGDDDEYQVELYGDLDRATVGELVDSAGMPSDTEIAERSVSLSRGSELKWPWAPGLIEGRAAFLAEHAPCVGVDLPPLGPTGPKTVTLAERADPKTERAIQSVLSSRSILTVELLNVPREDPPNPLNDYRVANYRPPTGEDEEGAFAHDRGDVSLAADGTVETGLYYESMLDAVYRPRLERDLRYMDDARLRVALNGTEVEDRGLNADEREFLTAYRDFIAADDTFDREPPEAPRLSLLTLSGWGALRTATLLRWPTAVRFGVGIERC